MPRYGRRYTATKSAYTRGYATYKKFANNSYNVANKALTLANKVKRLINVEFKTHDIANTFAVSSAGVINTLSFIDQGSDDNERDGNKIRAKSFLFRAYGEHDSAGEPAQLIRVIIFRDNMQRGAVPAVTDVLETANVLSPLNKDGDGRFTVLHDRMITVTSDKSQAFTKKYRAIDFHLNYTGTTGIAANMGPGNIYLLAVSNEPSANYPDLVFNFRLRYIDN